MTSGAASYRTEPHTRDEDVLSRHRSRAWLVALIALLTVVGCEADESPRRQLRTPAAEHQAPPAPYTPQSPIVVTLDEWRIYLDPYDVDAGHHEFLVVNEGLQPHAFVVEGGGQQWRTPTIAPGDQANLAANLEPGMYVLYCPLENELGDHSEMGMRATLEVGER